MNGNIIYIIYIISTLPDKEHTAELNKINWVADCAQGSVGYAIS